MKLVFITGEKMIAENMKNMKKRTITLVLVAVDRLRVNENETYTKTAHHLITNIRQP